MVSGIALEANKQTRQTGDNVTHTHTHTPRKTTTPAAVFNSQTILHLHSPLKITLPPPTRGKGPTLPTHAAACMAAVPGPVMRCWQMDAVHTRQAHAHGWHPFRVCDTGCGDSVPPAPTPHHPLTLIEATNPTSCNAMVQLPPCKTVFCDQCCMHAQRHGHHRNPANNPCTRRSSEQY